MHLNRFVVSKHHLCRNIATVINEITLHTVTKIYILIFKQKSKHYRRDSETVINSITTRQNLSSQFNFFFLTRFDTRSSLSNRASSNFVKN